MVEEWIHLDERRASWLFLTLGSEDDSERSQSTAPSSQSALIYWELSIGNPETIVDERVERINQNDTGSETALLEALLTEIDEYRYQNALLITPTQTTLQVLRHRLVQTDIQSPSLRGLSSVAIAAQLDRYFDKTLTDYGWEQQAYTDPALFEPTSERMTPTGETRALWELWREIFSLLPAAELAGDPL